MNKKTYYEVKIPSMKSKNGNILKTSSKMTVEVVVVESSKGRCLITPVAGYGTVSVLSNSVKII